MLKPDSVNRPPSAQTEDEGSAKGGDWLKKAREAYLTSTTYVDTNFRKQWEDGIRAFNGQHPADSKYSSPAYDKRSRLYRPKTRSVIRKNEAAAAAAFFSNMDTVSISAQDQSSKAQLASAEVMRALLQYRLNKSVPWFLFVQGGIQDAQVTGTVCAHVHWVSRYKENSSAAPIESAPEESHIDPENVPQPNLPQGAFTLGTQPLAPEQAPEGLPPAQPRTALEDRPVLDLIPIENMRIDPSANWMDPVNTSPYVIQLIPMYVMDIKKKIDDGEWLDLTDAQITAAVSGSLDTTRTARQKDREDPQSSDTRAYSDIDIVWVQRHIHRDGDHQDWDFYTLSDTAMLSEPKKLEETVFTGVRPYVMGTFILEAHRIMSSGVPQIGKGLQDEANEIANQRIDNVKFALNKKWFAKRGKDVDISGLTRNVPGGVVMMDDPTNDVREISWPDVTASSYEEQNRINLDMDELLGNFNPAALIANGGGNSPARNMAMLNNASGQLVEYGIRTFVETFLQPVLRQLIKLEQKYETDRVVISIAAKNAQLFQKFGIDQVTDELLNQELTLLVNVGMGATDPTQKLQKFLTGLSSFANVMKAQVPGMNVVEIGKEIFGHLGYSDASRFFTTDDPKVVEMQNALKGAAAKIDELEKKAKDKQDSLHVGMLKTAHTNDTKLKIVDKQEHNANLRALATHMVAITDQRKMSDKHRGT